MRPDLPVTISGSVGGLLLVLVLAVHAGHGMAAVTEQDVRGFLGRHCGECHGDDAAAVEGGFTIDKPWPSMSGIAGRVVPVPDSRPAGGPAGGRGRSPVTVSVVRCG